MCTDYRRLKGYDEMREEFSHIRIPIRLPVSAAIPNLEPQNEVRPTVPAVVFRQFEDGVELARLRWGLIPFFHRGPLKAWKFATFNARSETLKTTRSYREAFKRRRCLIAADGWVEWKGEGKPKPKFYIDRRDAAPICFAGLWDRCETEDAGIVESFTMVTQPPGAAGDGVGMNRLGDVHDRAPVVLTQQDWARWLDLDAEVDDLLTASPPDLYRIRPFADAAPESRLAI